MTSEDEDLVLEERGEPSIKAHSEVFRLRPDLSKDVGIKPRDSILDSSKDRSDVTRLHPHPMVITHVHSAQVVIVESDCFQLRGYFLALLYATLPQLQRRQGGWDKGVTTQGLKDKGRKECFIESTIPYWSKNTVSHMGGGHFIADSATVVPGMLLQTPPPPPHTHTHTQ